jgi:hypothetical protein
MLLGCTVQSAQVAGFQHCKRWESRGWRTVLPDDVAPGWLALCGVGVGSMCTRSAHAWRDTGVSYEVLVSLMRIARLHSSDTSEDLPTLPNRTYATAHELADAEGAGAQLCDTECVQLHHAGVGRGRIRSETTGEGGADVDG